MTLRIVLTVVEIALLVATLAFFLLRLTRQLKQAGDTLEKVAEGVKAIEGHCTIIGPGAEQLNGLLADSAVNLERAAAAAESLARSPQLSRELAPS